MHPFSYTGLKIIHDENIRKALEHQDLYAGPKMPRKSLRQVLDTFLAHFKHQPSQEPEACLSDASGEYSLEMQHEYYQYQPEEDLMNACR